MHLQRTIFEEVPTRYITTVLLLVSFLSLSAFGQTTAIRASCEPVRTEATFGKSQNDWEHYLKESVNTNIPAINCAPPGKYYIEVLFLIGRNGTIETVKPRTKSGYGMEEELMRVIHLSPSWTPAKQNGRNVRTYRCETFIFEVSSLNNAWL